MYRHSFEINPATRFYRKIEGQYIVHLPYWFRTAENTVCWSHSTVRQFNHFTTVLQTSGFMQASPSLLTVMKGHFLWYAFLNIWKRLLFAGDSFAGVRSIDSAMLSLEHETFLQMVLWFRRSIRLAVLRMRCSLWEISEKLFLLHVFRTCATCPKVALVSSGTKASASLGENRKGHVCLLLLFHKWQNPELLRRYLYFWKTLLILMIFQNKYGRAVTVGM